MALDDLTPNQAQRLATIRAAARGMTAYDLARVCNSLRPGVDFRGMGKKALYREFAKGMLRLEDGAGLRAAIRVFYRKKVGSKA